MTKNRTLQEVIIESLRRSPEDMKAYLDAAVELFKEDGNITGLLSDIENVSIALTKESK